MRPLPLATPVRPLIKIEGAKTDVHALEGALELPKCKLPYIHMLVFLANFLQLLFGLKSLV